MEARDFTKGLTAERLREVMSYDPQTGKFFWLQSNNQFPVGSEVGGAHNKGYRAATVDGHRYLLHRLAWLYIHGEWPKGQVDHKNLDRTDNRIDNLRLAVQAQNAANQRARVTSFLGIKGVRLHECGQYQARIGFKGKVYHLGLFPTANDASSAYVAKAKELYGEFARAS